MLLLDHNQTTSQNLRLHLFDDTEHKDIFFLDITPGELTAADFVFGGGGQVLIGDVGPGTANDNNANTINGTAGGDFILGMGGNDTLSGGAGDDFFSFFVNGHFAGPGVDS